MQSTWCQVQLQSMLSGDKRGPLPLFTVFSMVRAPEREVSATCGAIAGKLTGDGHSRQLNASGLV